MAEGDEELRDLYRDVLLDYFRSASHRGRVDPADVAGEGKNPLCGDEVRLTARVSDGRFAALRFEGHGCVISQASTAILAEAVEGLTLDEAGRTAEAFKDRMLGRKTFDDCPPGLEDARSLEGVARFPVRIKCAVLPWNTLLVGLKARREGTGAAVFEEAA